MHIAILNAGQPTDYLYGLVTGLASNSSLTIDVIDSDASQNLFTNIPSVRHYNFRGDNLSPQSFLTKTFRILRYYFRLLSYVPFSKARIFHIQWDNSIYLFDRTILLLYYRMFGKKIVYTVHNIDRQFRDTRHSSLYNRISLYCGYHLAHRLIVHTQKMKEMLCDSFSLSPEKVAVIPHGINVRVQYTGISMEEARAHLSISKTAKTLLFFGMIDRYKGLDIAFDAYAHIVNSDSSFFFLIAGKPKRSDGYFDSLTQFAKANIPAEQIRFDAKFIPSEEVEYYFASADCVILPYRSIYQSGIIFLAYRFGVPLIATDVGSFREDIQDGITGIVCKPEDPDELAQAIQKFFASELYLQRETTRQTIREMAHSRYSWKTISEKTIELYQSLCQQ
jgi:glycosyltransferase involved in cell wall biosynthesis